MRAIISMISIGLVGCAVAAAAETTATWEAQPFFARKAGQQVPPPAFFATTEALPAGAEVRIKVVECPQGVCLDVHWFLGGPVFTAGSEEYAFLTAGKMISHKLANEMRVAITASLGDEHGRCQDIVRKDGHDVLRYSFDKLGDLVIEVTVTGK